MEQPTAGQRWGQRTRNDDGGRRAAADKYAYADNVRSVGARTRHVSGGLATLMPRSAKCESSAQEPRVVGKTTGRRLPPLCAWTLLIPSPRLFVLCSRASQLSAGNRRGTTEEGGGADLEHYDREAAEGGRA